MPPLIGQALATVVWGLAALQHGVVARWQLLALGMSADAIRHRLATGRLHRIHPGVYAVGRPSLTRAGRWMAAVLASGRGAVLSHESAAALWGIRDREREIEVSVPPGNRARPSGIVVHRRGGRVLDVATKHQGIPVTEPIRTLLDLGSGSGEAVVEGMVNEADRLGLIKVDRLRTMLDDHAGQRGVRVVRTVLDKRTFTLTDSELERLFIRLVDGAGLPLPLTRQRVNGFVVDFFWPDLGLVVETDGLRYHRTPAQQARDRLRDQTHAIAGLESLRYTHAQVRYESGYVRESLTRVIDRLRNDPGKPPPETSADQM
jgi:very-short-patch-repair endonuclease